MFPKGTLCSLRGLAPGYPRSGHNRVRPGERRFFRAVPFIKLMNRISFYFFIALGIVPTIPLPCRANDSTAIPVLKQYGGRDWIYFAAAADDSLIFENLPNDGSNIVIAAERAADGRRILANTEIWIDNLGRLHTVGVLKLQLEYNAYLKEQTRIWGPDRTGATSVYESGILDFRTLSIPFAKLEPRTRRITDRLDDEEAAAKRLAATDPSAATLKNAYAAYLREKVSAAKALLTELYAAVVSVPTSKTGDTAPPSGGEIRKGLIGLVIPLDERDYLRVVSQDSREVRFVTIYPMLQGEIFASEIIDPAQMTPAIAVDLQEKVAAAEMAVIVAERLCRELLTPPCP